MSTRPRYLIALVASLAGLGMGFAATVPQQYEMRAEMRASVETKRRISKRAMARNPGAQRPIRKRKSISGPAKHSSRTKSRKRRRSVVRMRSHR